VAPTHLGPVALEPPSDIYSMYANPILAIGALGILVGLLVSLVALGMTTLYLRRRLGHW